MRKRQRGATLIGWLFIILPALIILYAAVRIAPAYFNYLSVGSSLKDIAREHGADDPLTVANLKLALHKRFEIEGISFPGPDDTLIRREGPHWLLEADYESSASLFAGLSLTATFYKRVEIK